MLNHNTFPTSRHANRHVLTLTLSLGEVHLHYHWVK